MLTNLPVPYDFCVGVPLIGAFSVIVKTDCETDLALHSTTGDGDRDGGVKNLCVDTSVLALDTTPILNTVEVCFSFQVAAQNVFVWQTNQTNYKYPICLAAYLERKRSIYMYMVESITHTCPDNVLQID